MNDGYPMARGQMILNAWDRRDKRYSDQSCINAISAIVGIDPGVVRVFLETHREDVKKLV